MTPGKAGDFPSVRRSSSGNVVDGSPLGTLTVRGLSAYLFSDIRLTTLSLGVAALTLLPLMPLLLGASVLLVPPLRTGDELDDVGIATGRDRDSAPLSYPDWAFRRTRCHRGSRSVP